MLLQSLLLWSLGIVESEQLLSKLCSRAVLALLVYGYLCSRLIRPQSVDLSVHLSFLYMYGLLTRKQKGVEKSVLV